MPEFTDPKAISNFISCSLAFALQQSQMTFFNWEIVPDGLAARPFFSLGSGYYPLCSSANVFHMLSLNSELSAILLHNMRKKRTEHGRTCGSSKTNCTGGKQQMKQLTVRKFSKREHSGLAVWRVQLRASNQIGTDDLYLLVWQWTFFVHFFRAERWIMWPDGLGSVIQTGCEGFTKC